MIYEVQTYDATDNTVYYETVRDAVSCEDARDMIDDKYPNRNVIAVQGRKTLEELTQEHSPDAPLMGYNTLIYKRTSND